MNPMQGNFREKKVCFPPSKPKPQKQDRELKSSLEVDQQTQQFSWKTIFSKKKEQKTKLL